MISIVYFTRVLPSHLADELACRGITCYEALAISEVFHLCEQPEIYLVVIDPSVDDERAKAVQQRLPALPLHDGATVEDTVWQLTNLLGKTFGYPIEPLTREAGNLRDSFYSSSLRCALGRTRCVRPTAPCAPVFV